MHSKDRTRTSTSHMRPLYALEYTCCGAHIHNHMHPPPARPPNVRDVTPFLLYSYMLILSYAPSQKARRMHACSCAARCTPAWASAQSKRPR